MFANKTKRNIYMWAEINSCSMGLYWSVLMMATFYASTACHKTGRLLLEAAAHWPLELQLLSETQQLIGDVNVMKVSMFTLKLVIYPCPVCGKSWRKKGKKKLSSFSSTRCTLNKYWMLASFIFYLTYSSNSFPFFLVWDKRGPVSDGLPGTQRFTQGQTKRSEYVLPVTWTAHRTIFPVWTI